MGTSHNSHGTKSDKETQSPLLKVFKDIMTKENNDPEKRNLLPYQNDEKKRKHYSSARTKKVNRKSSEVTKVEIQQSQHRKNNPYQKYSDQRHEFPQEAAAEVYPSTETKDSGWWNFTKDIKVCDMTSKKQKPPEKQDDTCSCTSCALKRIITDYCGVVCLSLLFAISLVAVFCFICTNFKSEGTSSESATEAMATDPLDLIAQKQGIADSERMKRRIEALQAKGGENGDMMKDEEGVLGKPHYDSIRSDPMDLSEPADIDLRASLRELDGLQSYSELPSLMNPTEVNMQSSNKLREFYKKLVQTDAKIKTLKRLTSNENENFINSLGFEMNTPDRAKRSLKLFNYPKRFKIKRIRIDRDTDTRQRRIRANLNKERDKRFKRFGNGSDNATGFVIEKKKFVFQFKPKTGKKLVAKCSHMPKDSHSHEHQLKHPYYQNSERLDQMLDKFFNKNLHDVNYPFGFENLFENVKKCKHLKSNNIKIVKGNKHVANKKGYEKKHSTIKSVDTDGGKTSEVHMDSLDDNLSHEPISILKPAKTEQENDFSISNDDKLRSDKLQTISYENSLLDKVVDMIDKEEQTYVTASPTGYDILLSISTVINPYVVKTSLHPNYLAEKIPNLRRLMQTEEEDSIAYEDFKEVLTDNMDNQDEMENGRDRQKRDNKLDDNPIEAGPDDRKIMYTPVSVNRNWKGPMPLYPDEIGSMMNKADDVNKVTFTIESNIKPTHKPEIKDIQDNMKPIEAPYIKAGQEQPKAAQDLDDKVTQAKPIARRIISNDDYFLNYDDIDNFVEMAQAYSDYGVLEEKKYSRNEEKNPATDAPYLRIQLSGNGEKYLKRGIMPRENSVRGIFSLFPKKENMPQKTSKINTNQYNMAIEPKVNNNRITKIFSLTTPHDKNMKLKNVFVSTIISTQPNNYAKDTKVNDFMDRNVNSKFDTSNKMKAEQESGVNDTIFNNIMWPYINDKNKRNINKNGELLSNVEADNAPSVNIAKDPIIGNAKILKYVSKVTQSNFDMFNASLVDVENPQNEEQIQLMNNVTTNEKPIEIDASSAFEKPNSSETESENNVEEPVYDSQTYLDLDDSEVGIDIPFVVNFNENDESNLLFEDEVKIKEGSYDFDDTSTVRSNSYEVSTSEIINSTPENVGIKKRVKRDTGTTEKQPLARAKPRKDTSDFKSVANNNDTTNNNYTRNNNITLGDFFMMMSDWFRTLEGVEVDDNKKKGNRSSSDITELLLLLNDVSNQTRPNVTTSTTERVYPLYDSDIIENIGHRSRVLLSIKDVNETLIKENVRSKNESKAVKVTEFKTGNISATESTKSSKKLNITNGTRNIEIINRSIHNKTKKVKRNADDSNLIFWTDMYDDEYGIQSDHLDKLVKDKDKKENYFIKRSEKWVQDKIKQFSNNFKADTTNLEKNNRIPREATNIGIKDYPKYYYNKIYDKLNKPETENDSQDDQKFIFDSLNAKMVRVCRNAAEAVKRTRSAEAAKAANKQSNAASSMMQKLMHLLTDLVDYQVEQNTCAKLPPDLRSFLEWLTEPEGTKDVQKNSGFASIMNDYIHRRNYYEKDQHRNAEYDITKTNKDVPADKLDTKSHVLETARSIQDLLDDYEEMNDEDKMKVTGVKFYLENQLRHLNKNYAFHDELNPFNKSPSDMEMKIPTLRKRRSLKKLMTEIKNKFRNKTTPKPKDNLHNTVTKMLKDIENKVFKVEKVIKRNKTKDKTRNLKDVYYTKPITTVKEAKKGVLDHSDDTA